MGLQIIDGLEAEDEYLIEVARQLQLTKTENENNKSRYEGLAKFVDGPGSPFEDLVSDVKPSGSNAIHAAIRGLVLENMPDVDGIVILDIAPDENPRVVQERLIMALTRGGDDSDETYRGCKVEPNSRCATVHYEDGSTVDLMPVVVTHDDEKYPIMNLFHYKAESGHDESYHKTISPVGFKAAVHDRLEQEPKRLINETLAKAFGDRQLLLEKAAVESLPEPEAFKDKSPRIVALQLIKRFRDIQFSTTIRKQRRKPPSVVLATLALEANFTHTNSLMEETLHVVRYIIGKLETSHNLGMNIDVRNPGYNQDILTDRWPEGGTDDQAIFLSDMKKMEEGLVILRDTTDLKKRDKLLQSLFGESVSRKALDAVMERKQAGRDAGRMMINGLGSTSVMPRGSSTGLGVVSSARRFGGPDQ
ncbi:hypothetical protein GCM10009069_29080 [Algimonas arctica]|uniref:Uncharacterized protein n=1 Tax=Algimonas arctica TaxID=1479486 RepID=A0A8J3G3T5_9PROT|nr:hypothetical protein [Algimonas arctica]GHB04713.1 hypothetical protein GCM10009069_29080 [Algimonas arctica]